MIQYPNTVRLLLHHHADITNQEAMLIIIERGEILHGQMSHGEEFDMCRGLILDHEEPGQSTPV